MNKYTKRCFSDTSKYIRKEVFHIKGQYNTIIDKEAWKKYDSVHPRSKWIIPFRTFAYTGFRIGWFNHEKDNDLGSARFDTNGAHKNSISNLLFRSKILQSNFIQRFFAKRLTKSNVFELNKAEPQPQITTNSVFLYKDNSSYFINRRSFERLFLAFILAQGVTLVGALMYAYIGIYFALVVSLILTNK